MTSSWRRFPPVPLEARKSKGRKSVAAPSAKNGNDCRAKRLKNRKYYVINTTFGFDEVGRGHDFGKGKTRRAPSVRTMGRSSILSSPRISDLVPPQSLSCPTSLPHSRALAQRSMDACHILLARASSRALGRVVTQYVSPRSPSRLSSRGKSKEQNPLLGHFLPTSLRAAAFSVSALGRSDTISSSSPLPFNFNAAQHFEVSR